MTRFSTNIPDLTLDQQSLFEYLEDGHTLLTANSRLSRVLHGQYSQWRMSRSDRQWQSPAIQSWEIWLSKLWEEASLSGIEGTGLAVPRGQQLISLWEAVLRNDPLTQHLLRPESLATQLRDTRKLAVEWQLDFDHPTWSGPDNENHAAFRQWNQAFEALCLSEHWIPPEDRIAVLSIAILDNKLPIADHIGLLGFDELNPAQGVLIDGILNRGTSVRLLSVTPIQTAAVLWQGRSNKDELDGMARWVRYWFEQEPKSRIAIVVPDLQARRQQVERHLQEILLPGTHVAATLAKPWNISMGVTLARVPMIESAFALLKLLNRRIGIQDIGQVLRSPWISGGVSERGSRALLDKCLRENYPRQLKLSEVRYRAREIRKYDHDRRELPPDQQEPRVWNSPLMARIIESLEQFERAEQSSRPASAWAEGFASLLANLGWPLGSEGEEKTDSSEHDDNWQAYQAWQDALRELASLDATSGGISRRAAIRQLHQICRERIFQPSTAPATIQVLGLYEASGLRFDHLWVLGLHSDNWPPTAQPNPFIPGSLQQKVQLPHSSPLRELEVARTVTQRLLEASNDTVFSFPNQVDGEAVLPSPLLDRESIKIVSELPIWQGDKWQQSIADSVPPCVEDLDSAGRLVRDTTRGGTSILRHQALCPFRAFASNRLGAEGLETPVDGISAMLHGSLVHRVLENFWKETRTQQALLMLEEKQLETRVESHVNLVLDDERGLIFRPAFREVESKRLLRQVLANLELEKARQPFEVTGFEREIMMNIEGQAIRLIIDRIDRLPGGEEVIIDYKTGRIDPRKWFGERPEDPQLPLYAISADSTPAAVVFSVIRDDGCRYQGVVSQEGVFPNLPPKLSKNTEYLVEAGTHMPETIENWRQILHRLMAEFLAGNSAIDPRDGSSTCKSSYCDLRPLCRLGELEQLEKTLASEVKT